MSLIGICSLESARRKFFMSSKYIMSGKVGIKRFWAQEAVMSLTGICSPESARRKFIMNSTYIISRK